MRTILRLALAASAVGAFAATPGLVGAAPARVILVAQPDEAPAKQTPLTQKQIDGTIAAQPAVHALEAKMPQGESDKPDPKAEAQLDSIAKKNGFAGLGEYEEVSSSISLVMAGMDPETKTYVGPEAVIKKQMADVQADKSMPPKEKKEALAELKAAMGSAASAQPLPANIELVSKNFEKLAKSMQQDAD